MNNVLYVGYNGFPNGLAQVQRQLLIAKGLVENGCRVLVLNRFGVHDKNVDLNIQKEGLFEGINYKYCSGTPFRSNKFIERSLFKIKGFFLELTTIIKERYKNKTNTIVITSNTFRGILYYTILSKILGITSVVDQVEYWSAISLSWIKKIDSFLNDRYFGYFPDKVIVISDFLLEKAKKVKNSDSIIKIPAICDFTKFDRNGNASNFGQYFLYCGSANYFEVVKFIVDAYSNLNTTHRLVLVVSGNKPAIEKVRSYFLEKDITGISIKSNIPYIELINLYQNSLALLIPLRSTLQDIARFPHKLGEYTASKRPIVSTNVGEVSTYFEDRKDAFLSESYEVHNFSKKMQEVIDFPEQREKVALQSYGKGLKEFDYKKNSIALYNFLFHSN